MCFPASESYDYFRPSPCGLRVFLRDRGEPEAEPGAFDLLLRRSGCSTSTDTSGRCRT